MEDPDFLIPVVLEGNSHNIYVAKRPYVEEFLRRMSKVYELVVFTASISLYADPLLDLLDKEGVIAARLFRQHCTRYKGCYVKDLSKIGRPMHELLIVDNSAKSYMFQRENAIASDTWISDRKCVQLEEMADYLESIADASDLRDHTQRWNEFIDTFYG